ncbi:MAG: tripartite tricarboxylate transporter substrate binding protein BugE [Comamonas sp.]
MEKRRVKHWACTAFTLIFFSTGGLHAQIYPSRPINWIVPFPPGGTTDVVARVIADQLGKELGQPITVDNRAGAGGSIGTLALKRATPDGYTIGMATVSTHAVNPACNPKLGYDPAQDFRPVAALATTANVLTVSNTFPATTYPEFLAELKAHPQKYSYASTGHCGGMHMMGELYKVAAGVSMVHVPYRGAGPAINDLIGGQVPIMFDNLPSSIGHISGGNIRAIAVAAPTRIASMPHTPTFQELGLPSVNDAAWYGVMVPAKVPDAVVQRLNEAFAKVLSTSTIRQKLLTSGAEPARDSSAHFFGEIIQADLRRMRELVRQQGISLE